MLRNFFKNFKIFAKFWSSDIYVKSPKWAKKANFDQILVLLKLLVSSNKLYLSSRHTEPLMGVKKGL